MRATLPRAHNTYRSIQQSEEVQVQCTMGSIWQQENLLFAAHTSQNPIKLNSAVCLCLHSPQAAWFSVVDFQFDFNCCTQFSQQSSIILCLYLYVQPVNFHSIRSLCVSQTHDGVFLVLVNFSTVTFSCLCVTESWSWRFLTTCGSAAGVCGLGTGWCWSLSTALCIWYSLYSLTCSANWSISQSFCNSI